MITYLTITKAREGNAHVKCCRTGVYYVLYKSDGAPAGMLILTETHSDINERGGHRLLGTTVCTVNR